MSDTYTKGIYIKGEEGLSSLVRTSKEDISDALGYKPATEQSVTDVNSNLTEHINNNDASKQHITEEEKNKLLHLSYDDLENAPAISDDDNSGTLYIADEEDNVIAKVDSEGVHSVGFHAGEEGITGDGETFIIVDKNDNKALEIEANGGVRVSELYLGQSGGPLSEILTNQTESNKNLTDHINNEARHVSPEEEALWSDKSFASITDNPIEVTEDGEFVIVDDDDNKGLVLDGTGLTVDKEVYIQTKEGDANKVAVAKTLEEVQVAIEEIPDWALQAEKPEYSYSEIQGEYKDILNAPDIEDDSSNELIIMDQNDVIGTRIGENGIETINDITITYLKGKGESQTTEVMSVRDKFVEIEEAAAGFKTEVQTSIQQLTTDIGNLSNIMNFRGAFVSLSAVIDPKPGDVVIITNDYEDAIYGKVKANSEWVYDEVGAWVEIGTASATDAAVANLQERVEVIEEDLNTATTGLKDRMTAIEDEVDEFKEEVATQLAELPEVPDWATQPTAPTYEYDDLTTRPQIEDYIEDDEFVIADSEDRKGLQLTEEGLETVGNVIITYKDEEEKEQVLDVRQKFKEIDTSIFEVNNKKLDKNLGEENANKILSIDAEGNIIPIDNTTGGGGGGDFEQVQADWEENDATSNAYIKNRPFYVNNYNLPFQRMTFEPSTYNSNVYKTSLIGLVAADGVEGQEYVVEWDGVEYVTTCRKVTFDLVNNDVIGSIELKRTIGNPALWNSEGVIESQEQDSGEPFFLQLDTTLNAVGNSAVGMDLDCAITKDTSPIHTIRVFGTSNVVQLDEKFIPDSVKLPSVTEDDNGKTIGVVDGEWSVVDMPEGGNGGPVHWNDVTGKPFIKENKHIFVDHSKVDTSIAFTSAELNATFVRLTEETFTKDELIGATITATFASGDKMSNIVSESNIQSEDNNGLTIMFAKGLPIAVFYKAGQYTANIFGVETTVQIPKAGIYTVDYAVVESESSEIVTNVTREYLDNKCLSILEISSKPTEFLHKIEFTNEWNDLFRLFTYLNPIDEETFNAWNANTEPVIVNYDDVEYICMPQAGVSGIAVGNWASFEGGTGNNEPFVITCGYDNVLGLYVAIIGSTVDTEPTAHSVAIYLQDEAYKIKDEYLEDFRKEMIAEAKAESKTYTDTVANGKPGMKTEGVGFVDASGSIQVCMDGEVFNSYANELQLDANNRPVSGNIAAGLHSHAEGDKTFAWGQLAHTEGYLTYVGSTGIYGHAEGYNTVVSNLCGHAEGASTKATGMASHAEGNSTKTSANYAHAEGDTTVASGDGAHAEGGYTNLLHTGSGGEITSQSTTASGKYSHAEGKGSVASGEASHAEGWGSIASGKYSHAEGGGTSFDDGETLLVMSKSTGTIASGDFSHAEGKGSRAAGMASHAEGTTCDANGDGSHAEGYGTEARGLYAHSDGYQTLALGDYSHAGGYKTYAEDYQYVVGRNNSRNTTCPESADTNDNTNSDAIFIIGYGTASSQGANAFRVSSGGKCFGTTAFGTSGADFAELFEWADGNPNNEDRRGLFVALDGERIRLANAGDDYIGVISGSHAFLGNSASEEWHDKYLTDVFGARLTQEVKVSAEINEITGEVIRPATTTTQYVLNPDYNPNTPYVMRENRKEWGIVGLLGQVVMIDDGTCVAGGYVAPSKNGIGTISDKGYRVMKRIDANHVKILIK